jgi:hypothetical protein
MCGLIRNRHRQFVHASLWSILDIDLPIIRAFITLWHEVPADFQDKAAAPRRIP